MSTKWTFYCGELSPVTAATTFDQLLMLLYSIWREKVYSYCTTVLSRICATGGRRLLADDDNCGCLCSGEGRKTEWKRLVLYWHQAIWIFFFSLRSQELGLFTVKFNHRCELHSCWQQQVAAAVFRAANNHPRKLGIHYSAMTRWCQALICIRIKLLKRSGINRGRAQWKDSSHFSRWLILPYRA